MRDCNTNNDCMCDKIAHELKYEIATNQTAVMASLGDHIRNYCAHVSPNDRQYWNNKADKNQVEQLEKTLLDKLVNKATEIVKETVADGVAVNAEYTDLTSKAKQIGTLKIGDKTMDIYQWGTGEPGGSGTEVGITEEEWERIKTTIAGLRDDLNNVNQWSEQQIKQFITDILNDKNFIEGDGYAGWTEGFKSYLISKGLLDENGNKGWAYLEVKYNELESAVQSLLIGEDGTTLESLQAYINQKVSDGIAALDLNTKWAKYDKYGKDLEWLMSGFRSLTSSYDSFAELYSTMNDNLAANVRTEVNSQLQTAKSEIGASVDLKLAGFVAESSLKDAVATVIADSDENDENSPKAIIRAIASDEASKIEMVANKISMQTTSNSIVIDMEGRDLRMQVDGVWKYEEPSSIGADPNDPYYKIAEGGTFRGYTGTIEPNNSVYYHFVNGICVGWSHNGTWTEYGTGDDHLRRD